MWKAAQTLPNFMQEGSARAPSAWFAIYKDSQLKLDARIGERREKSLQVAIREGKGKISCSTRERRRGAKDVFELQFHITTAHMLEQNDIPAA